MAIRVILAEDSYLAREGIQQVLETAPGLDVVATCEDLDSLIAAVESDRPDVVVTDIRMPPTNTDEGIRAAAQLRQSHPEIGVVVLSQHDDPAYALALLESGSEGRAYLLKERIHERAQLVTAVEEVAGGGSVIDSKVVDSLVGARSRLDHSPLAELTTREREVLAEIAKGKKQLSDRGVALPDQAGGREAHQRDLHEVGPGPGRRRQQARQSGADVPLRYGARAVRIKGRVVGTRRSACTPPPVTPASPIAVAPLC
jgi:DNA-binding NarL/FixJ family response regulator